MRSGVLTCDHFIQPQCRISRLRFGDDFDAGTGATLVDFVDEIAVVATETFAARITIRTIRERREANRASTINGR